MIKIWERYFLKEIFKITLLLLLSFYFLYFLIDYSSRGSRLTGLCSLRQLTFYYFLVYLKNIDILLPFALLLATIKTLCSLNIHHELIALMASGISLKTLLRPFLLSGLIGVASLYIHYEYLLPYAFRYTHCLEDQHALARLPAASTAHDIALNDGSIILYQSYDSFQKRFFDAYWIKSMDDIYRIKYLYPYECPPRAFYADHLQRDPKGEWTLTERSETKPMAEMRFDKKRLHQAILPAQELSLSQLRDRTRSAANNGSEKAYQAAAWGHKRILMPWLCLLAIMAPVPYCLTFTRRLRIFLIYIFLMLAMICFYLVINAATVLAQAQVISPPIAIGIPFALIFSFFGWKYVRLTH